MMIYVIHSGTFSFGKIRNMYNKSTETVIRVSFPDKDGRNGNLLDHDQKYKFVQ